MQLFKWVKDKWPNSHVCVALNTDASVEALKREIMHPYEVREEVLQGIKYVDSIIPMEQDNPAWLIRHMKPDVFVKGPDYRDIKELPEYIALKSYGGEFHICPLNKVNNSSDIREKLNAGI